MQLPKIVLCAIDLTTLAGREVAVASEISDNILVDGATTRVIDFDDFGWSWISFEVATSLFALQLTGGFDVALAGYLEGYRAVRPFPAGDLEVLPELLMARGLSYLGWPVGRPEIESTRNLVPMLVFAITDAAQRYLAASTSSTTWRRRGLRPADR